MGKNNQQRRAAKRRQRAATRPAGTTQAHSAQARTPDRPADPRRGADPVDPEIEIGNLLAAGAALAFGEHAHEPDADKIVEALVARPTIDIDRPLRMDMLATERLLILIGLLWENGWQPLDLAHIVRRHQNARGVALVIAVILEQARRDRAADRAPGDWLAQLQWLEPLGLTTGHKAGQGANGWLVTRWQFSQRIGPWDGWTDVLRLIAQLQALHRLTPLVRPPSAWERPSAGLPRATTGRPDQLGHDPRMLGKIRALLSKAEATTFAEEADAFTSKAQDLMTRYAIDEALLDDAEGHGDVVTSRIHIDNPYAQAKAQLLSTVGTINRVRVIWDDHHGMATAVGMALDLQLVEMLFTSLLVQATRALTDAGNVRRAESGYLSGRPNRSPSFRRAFLLAYANRIGERLEAAGAQAGADAGSSHGAELVPVLARRAEAVDTTFDRFFPETREMRSRSVDAHGWHAGVAAADRAVFAAGQVPAG